MVKDCTHTTQHIVVEHHGNPIIADCIDNIEFCMANLKETEQDEFGQNVNVCYSYRIGISSNGHPIFICQGRYGVNE